MLSSSFIGVVIVAEVVYFPPLYSTDSDFPLFSTKTFNQPPSSADVLLTRPCVTANTISIGLYQIPNQRITFTGDPKHQSRSEDALIAYTWAHYINNTLEADWLARMPMTKVCFTV